MTDSVHCDENRNPYFPLLAGDGGEVLIVLLRTENPRALRGVALGACYAANISCTAHSTAFREKFNRCGKFLFVEIRPKSGGGIELGVRYVYQW